MNKWQRMEKEALEKLTDAIREHQAPELVENMTGYAELVFDRYSLAKAVTPDEQDPEKGTIDTAELISMVKALRVEMLAEKFEAIRQKAIAQVLQGMLQKREAGGSGNPSDFQPN